MPTIKFNLGARSVVWADKGRVIVAIDYSGQELMIATYLSKDPTMFSTFSASETILDSQGNVWDNPDADMHTLTTKQIYPEIFLDFSGNLLPKWDWVRRAKDASLIKLPGKPRDVGKKVNFGILYFQTAASLSEQAYVPIIQTEKWVKAHQELYPQFHMWAKEEKGLAEARHWARTKWFNRQRYCQESNAKGAKESTGIMGVNHLIQGCLQAESLILTDKGWQKIENLSTTESTQVWTGFNWAPAKMLSMGKNALARITLSSGLVINCDTRHKLKTNTYTWSEFKELKEGSLVALPTIQKHTLPSEEVTWEYILGLYLGDGCIGKNALSICGGLSKKSNLERISLFLSEKGYISKVKKIPGRLPHHNLKYLLVSYSKPLCDFLIEKFDLNINLKSRTKTVPERIWKSSLLDKSNFLQGIFDSDGSKGTDLDSLHTPNLKLLQQLQLLQYELGYDSYLTSTKSAFKLSPYLKHNRGRRYPKNILLEDFKNTEVVAHRKNCASIVSARVIRSNYVPSQKVAEIMYANYAVHTDLYRWDIIKSIEILEERGQTYTLNVDDPRHQFVADGVITKNCGADITKGALVNIDRLLNSPAHLREIPELRDVKVIAQVHDEILFEGPGHLKLDLANSKYDKNGAISDPKWIIPQSVYDWIAPLEKTMIQTETESFEGELIGRIGSPAISQFWSK